MTTVRRRATAAKTPTKKKFDPAEIAATFTEFRRLKTAEAVAKEGHEKLRDEKLMPALIQFGEAWGEKGQHLAIELPEPIDGFTRIVRRTNVSRVLDIDAAEALLEKKGVLAEAQVATIRIDNIPGTVIDEVMEALAKIKLEKNFGLLPALDISFSQDGMYAIYQRQRQELQERIDAGERVSAAEKKKYLTEEELDALIEETETYSLNPEKS